MGDSFLLKGESEVKLRHKEIGNFKEPLFIAEIGCNYDGDIELAKKLIYQAKEIGCDYTKFQSFDKDSLFIQSFYKNNPGDISTENLEQTLDRLSLKSTDLSQFYDTCRKANIGFASTPVSKAFVDSLISFDVEFIKIASFDLNNIDLLRYAASKGKPIILSVGLGTLQEIEEAIEAIFSTGNKDIVLLHCAAAYPPKDENIHLNNIDLLRDYFQLPVGFSDHTKGFSVCLAAIAKGACVIEKHFTYDNTLVTGDHSISANAEELKIIVDEGKRIYRALGQYKRIISDDDIEFKRILRRSIVSSKNINKGDRITNDMIDFKRPGTGIQINEMPYLLGRKVNRDIPSNELIFWTDLD